MKHNKKRIWDIILVLDLAFLVCLTFRMSDPMYVYGENLFALKHQFEGTFFTLGVVMSPLIFGS